MTEKFPLRKGGRAEGDGVVRRVRKTKGIGCRCSSEIECAEASPIRKRTPRRLRDRVKSSQNFTCAAAPFD